MKIFLAGGTGFIGSETLRRFLEAGHQVRCLVRPNPRRTMEFKGAIEICSGDINAPLEEWVAGCDVVVNLVGITREGPGAGQTFRRINFEGAVNLVEAAKKAGVKKIVQMSAMGACREAHSQYQYTKYLADEYIRQSGLDYVIFQPVIAYGPHDNTTTIFTWLVRWFPILPLLTLADSRLQPTASDNLAEGLLKAAAYEKFNNQTFVMGGPEKYTFEEFFQLLARMQGKRVLILKHPRFIIEPAIRILEKLPFFPMNLDKLHMLSHDNTCDPAPFFEAFQIRPIHFPHYRS